MRLLRSRVAEDSVYAVATWAVVGGIIGARLFHVIDSWDFYRDHLELIPQIWNGGIAILGAVIVGTLTGYVVAVRRGDIPIGATADAAAPGIGLGMAIGRIGDVINGEHHALPCSPPGLCVGYDHPDTLGQAGPVHLAVGYEMLWDLAAVGLALLLRRRLAGHPEGRIFWIWLAVQSVGRVLISFLRLDTPGIFGLYQAQLVSLVLIALALPLFVALQRQHDAARALASRAGPTELPQP